MIRNLLKRFEMFAEDKTGQGMVEYALLISFVALALVFAVVQLGNASFNLFSFAAERIANLGN